MKYEKPELTAVGSATNAVQGMGKEPGLPVDIGGVKKTTAAAYESDE
jgi:hypothetical protein